MVRKYKCKPGARKYKDFTVEELQKALEEIKTHRMTYKEASKSYNIGIGTLARYMKKACEPTEPEQNESQPEPPKKPQSLELSKPGLPSALSSEEEKSIVKHAIKFLRREGNLFVWPLKEDIDNIPKQNDVTEHDRQMLKVISEPTMDRRGRLKFSTKFSTYNIQ